MSTLSDRQATVLQFLQEFHEHHGHAPTEREIQEGMGFKSKSVARHYLSMLERKGAIELQPGKARGLILPEARRVASRPMITIPVFGSIPAGFPVDGEQQEGVCITVDADTLRLPRNARTFALRVRGDSMTGAAVLEGDIVIMECRNPRHGEIVAALVDGETTLKTYVVRRGKPCLRAENPEYPDIIPGRDLVIQGVMIAVLRVPPRLNHNG
ncbi:MAG TPA: transcriptional repressor LexA [Verrucomicrobiales bacterium]|nr:transcriptional repressor LexA [Verrucomicrobiales bacterium]